MSKTCFKGDLLTNKNLNGIQRSKQRAVNYKDTISVFFWAVTNATTQFKTKELTSYTMPVCLWGKEGRSRNKQLYEKLKEIEKECEKASEKIGIRNVDLNTFY